MGNSVEESDREARDTIKKAANTVLDKSAADDYIGPDFNEDFHQMWKSLREELIGRFRPKQIAFLAAYSILGSITYAAKCANITPRATQKWRKEDEEFAEYFERAEIAHTEYLEVEAQRRAVMGIDEPVYYQGEKIGTKKKYSDNLLMFLLKGKKPDQYRDNAKIEVTGGEDANIQVNFGIPAMNQEVDDSEVIEGKATEED